MYIYIYKYIYIYILKKSDLSEKVNYYKEFQFASFLLQKKNN